MVAAAYSALFLQPKFRTWGLGGAAVDVAAGATGSLKDGEVMMP